MRGILHYSTPMLKALSEDFDEMLEVEYSKHFVCFIDMLGVKQNVDDALQSQKIHSALNIYNKVRDAYRLKQNISLRIVSPADNSIISSEEFSLPYESSFFSDSLIISYEHSDPRNDYMDLYCILSDINMLLFELLKNGIFVRGGFSYGDLYHKGDVCFGSALVEAVYLENKIAITPRVAIAPYIFDETSEKFPFLNIGLKSLDRSFSNIRNKTAVDKTTEPSIRYFDFLCDYLYRNYDVALKVKSHIIKELNAGHTKKIMKKYEWFRDYFNSQLRTTKCPPDWFPELKI